MKDDRAARLGSRVMAIGIVVAVAALGLAAWSVIAGGDDDVAHPPIAEPTGPERSASFDKGGGYGQFDQLNQVGGSASIDKAPDGTRAMHARYDGEGGNGYARAIFNVRWKAGDTVRYSARFYIPQSLIDASQGQVGIMRWDDFEDHPLDQAHGGIVIFGKDKRARLVRELLDEDSATADEAELGDSFPVPTDRWFKLEVWQRLGSAEDGARSEVYLDGQKVTDSNATNLPAGREVSRIRYGLVAIASGVQTNPIELWFDDAIAQPAVRGES